MTSDQSSHIIQKAARDFARVTTADTAELRQLLTLLEHTSLPAADVVLLLADLEIDCRRLMRRVRACVRRLDAVAHTPEASDAAGAALVTRLAA